MNKKPFGTLHDDGDEHIVTDVETKKFGDIIVTCEDGLFHGYVDGRRVQPNHDANGIVKWLGHILANC